MQIFNWRITMRQIQGSSKTLKSKSRNKISRPDGRNSWRSSWKNVHIARIPIYFLCLSFRTIKNSSGPNLHMNSLDIQSFCPEKKCWILINLRNWENHEFCFAQLSNTHYWRVSTNKCVNFARVAFIPKHKTSAWLCFYYHKWCRLYYSHTP